MYLGWVPHLLPFSCWCFWHIFLHLNTHLWVVSIVIGFKFCVLLLLSRVEAIYCLGSPPVTLFIVLWSAVSFFHSAPIPNLLFLLGRCSYSSRGTDLVSSVSVPLGEALKKYIPSYKILICQSYWLRLRDPKASVSVYVWYWVHGFTPAGAKISGQLQGPMEVAHQ